MSPGPRLRPGDEEVTAAAHETRGPDPEPDDGEGVDDEKREVEAHCELRSKSRRHGVRDRARRAGLRTRWPESRLARSLQRALRPRARRSSPTSACPSHRPVASANTVSPSAGVCGGIDRSRQAIVGHQRHAAGLGLRESGVGGDDSNRRVRAGVQAHSPTASADRISRRASASRLPSSVRTPATTAPVAGSMMSPTAFTATSAATTRPFGNAIAAVPTPAFIARSRFPASLPTVAPAPAPMFPSATGPSLAVDAAR